MAPKAKPDASVMFLYLCLLNSTGGTNVNFNAVAEATNLNPSAARMRFYRLKKVLEPQIVDGKVDLTKAGLGDTTDGGDSSVPVTPTSTPKKPKSSPTKRRKIDQLEAKAEAEKEEVKEEETETETAMEE